MKCNKCDLAFFLRKMQEFFAKSDFAKAVRAYFDKLKSDGELPGIVGQAVTGAVKLVVPGGNKVGTVQYLYNPDTGHAVVIDLGADDGTALINSMLAHGVTEIDAICITHMHNDHCSPDKLSNVLDAFECGGVYWYEPSWRDWDGLNYEAVYRHCEAVCIEYDVAINQINGEGYIIPNTLPGVEITCSNCTDSITDNYLHDDLTESMSHSGHTELNNYSTIYTVHRGSSKVVCTGDIMINAQRQNRNALAGADLYSVPHHGLNITSDPRFLAGSKGVAYCGAYGTSWETKVSQCYPDIAGKTVYTNMEQELVFDIRLTGVSSPEIAPIYTEGHAGYYIPDGIDVLTLQPGRYYTVNAAHSASLSNIPGINSAFTLDVRTVGRLGVQYVLTTMYTNVPETFVRNEFPDKQPGAYGWVHIDRTV